MRDDPAFNDHFDATATLFVFDGKQGVPSVPEMSISIWPDGDDEEDRLP